MALLSINGVVVTWVVAIDPPGVRFPLNAFKGWLRHFALRLFQLLVDRTRPRKPIDVEKQLQGDLIGDQSDARGDASSFSSNFDCSLYAVLALTIRHMSE